MTQELTAADMHRLAEGCYEFAKALRVYRDDHWDELTDQERGDLKRLHHMLIDTSRSLVTDAVIQSLIAIGPSVAVLNECAAGLKQAAENIANVKKAIELATTAITLVASISVAAATGNVSALIGTAAGVLTLAEEVTR